MPTSKKTSQLLLRWYDRHRRVMPWRALPGEKPDPYRVWLSEIMLQQTTVATVGPYFTKFIKRWPTVKVLASASLDDVLRMWAGLGYYRRARSLHACAQVIVRDYGGVFPVDENELLGLPGFGLYTAAAVRAIAFDKTANVVDGNVERVMARMFAIKTPLPKGKKALRDAAEKMLPSSRYGDYAQALMDLGATICTPRSPKCGLCPWAKQCVAHKLGIEETLPRRAVKKTNPVRRCVAFVALNARGEVLLRQRPATGLLGGMMEVPSSAWAEAVSHEKALADAPFKAQWRVIPGAVRHVFSHFTLEATVAVAKVKSTKAVGQWVSLDAVEDEALPSVMLKIIRHAMKSE